MFRKIMVPIDLEHAGRLEKARAIAADLAKRHGAALCFVGVSAPTPGRVARSPEEFDAKLAAFARAEAEAHGLAAESRTFVSHDPATELDRTLEAAIRETGADLVVIGSHVPNLIDRLWSSHGGELASRAEVSVFVVR